MMDGWKENKMEMFIYLVGAITAVIGLVVYMVYTQVDNIDQNMWQQNNALKEKISILESELASLTTELKELKAEKEVSEEEDES